MQAAQDPMDGECPWTKLQSNSGILKAAGWKLKAGMKARTVKPVEVENTALPSAGRLNPAKRFRAAAAIVGRKEDVPRPQQHHRTDNVDD